MRGMPNWLKGIISVIVVVVILVAILLCVKQGVCKGCCDEDSGNSSAPQPCANGCSMNVAGKHALVSALPGGSYCQECQARKNAEDAAYAQEWRDRHARQGAPELEERRQWMFHAVCAEEQRRQQQRQQ